MTDCILWHGKPNQSGYGRVQVKIDNKWITKYVHRVKWEEANGPIPEGLTVDHLCFVPLCINTEHMELVTLSENLRRKNAAITHCPQGHEYNAENTHRRPNGSRSCRVCNKLRMRARRKK